MKRLITTAAALALLVAGCADQGETPTLSFVPPTASPPPATEAATPSPTAEASPTDDAEATRDATAEETITGILAGDDIEGGCVFVTADDGTNYEVIWPEGWDISFETMELRDETGELVAIGGDRLSVHGRMAEGQASICQVGPIFEAVEVEVED